jgi:Kef-type K+ transport system membrane component KefB
MLLLLLLLLASRVGGEIMERLGQLALIWQNCSRDRPRAVGARHHQPSPELKVLSDLGVFLLVMLAGMEMQFGDIKESFRGRAAR